MDVFVKDVSVYKVWACVPFYPESCGRVVTRWPGSQKVGGSITAATKIVRCKNLAFNNGGCVSHGSDTIKLLVPCISGESSPSM